MMVASTALLTGFLAGPLSSGKSIGPVLWVIGGAASTGILVLLMSRLLLGPTPTQITRWSSEQVTAPTAILDAKLLALQANSRALMRAEFVFWIQAVATVIGIILMIRQAQGGAP